VPTDVVLSSQRFSDSRLGCQKALEGNKLGYRRCRYVTSGTTSLTLLMEDTLTFTSALTQQPVIHTALQGKLQTPVFTEPRQVTPHSAQNDQKCHVFRSFTRAMTLITETHTKSVCLSSCSSLQNTQYLAAYAECPR